METGRAQSRLEVLVQFLRQFERDYGELLREGAKSVVKRFEATSSYARGKRVRVTNGRESFTGVTAGLEEEGLLRVKRDTGETTAVIAGDVTEIR
jgi:BirA family transcriptional regulator, biotin operon repressor / biotin---[acetyl-CoA-carboxylase] ligase